MHVANLLQAYGMGFYLIAFLIIWAETGLVFTPFLPGDSLLFTLGALCAPESSPLHLPILVVVLTSAAFLGYEFNFWSGAFIQRKFFGRLHL